MGLVFCTSKSPATAPEICLMASRPPLVTPSGRLDVAQWQVSLSEDAKVEYRPVGLQERQVGGKVNNGFVHNLRLLTSPGPAHIANNFSPNEFRGAVNSNGLAVYKASTQEIIVATESK